MTDDKQTEISKDNQVQANQNNQAPPAEPSAQNTPPDASESHTSDFMNNPDILSFIKHQIDDGIKSALKGQTPKANPTTQQTIQKTDFERMTYRERLQLFKSNPHEYNKLSKGGV